MMIREVPESMSAFFIVYTLLLTFISLIGIVQ
jgi:hypothetical protein